MHLPLIPSKAEPPLFVATSSPVRFAAGFYDNEQDGPVRFRWAQERARLEFVPAPVTRYLECWVLSVFTDLSQILTIATGAASQEYSMASAWSPLSIDVPAGVDTLALTASKPFPAEY